LRCNGCRFAWIPQGVARRADGSSIYEGDTTLFVADEQSDYYRDESTVDAARDKVAWVARWTADGSRLLDVGANFGYFAREAATRFDAHGIEPSALTVAWGRKQLSAPIEVGSIYDDRPDLVGRFDAITLFDVIEHLPDPPSALAHIREWLAPGGRLFLTTPDTGALVARLLDRQWYYIDLTEHISLFDRANLGQLLAESGFDVLETRSIGRRYKLSYIERRFGQLADDRPSLRVVHLATQLLRPLGGLRVPINLGDVMGFVAQRR
jgi:2-polyprenyl-3-methyl-5-hydroxy-6-metoxy-1,4-benzoquinol methylase